MNQRGAVSLFSVIFAMLLMSVVTISFLRIMIADQAEATNNDLAQSAYDSAEAGVEDAKRALIWYVNQCKSGSASACSTAQLAISSSTCNVAIRTANGWTETNGEIKVQQSAQVDEATGVSIDQALEQANLRHSRYIWLVH
jgi:Tfp pilus assembly protein PilX